MPQLIILLILTSISNLALTRPGYDTCSMLDFIISGDKVESYDVEPLIRDLDARLARYIELARAPESSLLNEVLENTPRSREEAEKKAEADANETSSYREPNKYELNRRERKSIAEYLITSTSWVEDSCSRRFMDAESAVQTTQVPYVNRESRSAYDARDLAKAALSIQEKYAVALRENRAYRDIIRFRQAMVREVKGNEPDLVKAVIKDALDSSVLGRMQQLFDRQQPKLEEIRTKIEQIGNNLRRQKQEQEYKRDHELSPETYIRQIAQTEKDIATVAALLPARQDPKDLLKNASVSGTPGSYSLEYPR